MAAEGDLDVFDDGVWWEVEKVGELDSGLEFYVVDGAGGFVVEMAVFVKIRAVAGRFAVEIDLANDLVLHEGFEAVVDSGKGYVGEGFLDPYEYLVCGGMGLFPHEETVDFLALASHAEAVDFLRDASGLDL